VENGWRITTWPEDADVPERHYWVKAEHFYTVNVYPLFSHDLGSAVRETGGETGGQTGRYLCLEELRDRCPSSATAHSDEGKAR